MNNNQLKFIKWAMIICICASFIVHIYFWKTGQWNTLFFYTLFVLFALVYRIVINRNK